MQYPKIRYAAIAVAGLVGLGACASVSNDPPTLSSGEEVVETETAAEVDVYLTDHDITLSQSSIDAGGVVFHVWNNGDENHDFEIRDRHGNQVDEELKFTLDPDNDEDVEMRLEPGEYVILCTLQDHEHEGEVARLTVA